ncbi:MAG TPA: class I SAM-dependent methyltransferase [Candidatus Polarisedimenticolaceae bacterium]|nr:class I SAM-dependent methyltransferase [Candidatus Polarisedimenticolaceae bacterium]
MSGAVSDTWERGDPYERYIGRWSRRVAQAFLTWLAVPPGERWLDVGCGTGALSEAILECSAPSALTCVEPSPGFLEVARRRLQARATLHAGSAAALPLENDAVTVVVSGLVLNFVPDLPAALREMIRVTAPGGTIAAYVWDYAEGMELVRHFWDAAVKLDPGAAALHEGARFPLCNPAALRAAFQAAGLAQIETTGLEIPTVFADFEDYWTPFLGGQGPAPAYAMSLPEDQRTRLKETLRKRLAGGFGGALSLTARAWAVRGAVGRTQ